MPRTKKAQQGSDRTGENGSAGQADGGPMSGVNKTQAIAEAQRELGGDASNQDLAGYARQKFGLDVVPQYVSVIKINLKKRGGKTGPSRGRGGRRKAKAQNGGAEVSQRRTSRSTAADPVALIREVKELASRAGGMEALRAKSERLTGYLEFLLDKLPPGFVRITTQP